MFILSVTLGALLIYQVVAFFGEKKLFAQHEKNILDALK